MPNPKENCSFAMHHFGTVNSYTTNFITITRDLTKLIWSGKLTV